MLQLLAPILRANKARADSDELVPQEGKDEEYDTIMEEIGSLEEDLEGELKRLKKELK